MRQAERNFNASLCVTHNCNLSCVYCYQKHDTDNRMTFETARTCIDWIFDHVPADRNGVIISFIGGEPLLEYELIKQVFIYTANKDTAIPYQFYASTNGTLLSDTMKRWFTDHKERFILGLSLDGSKDVQDRNRSNSFDLIDIPYFIDNWPNQGVKMTLSEYSIRHLAESVKYLHGLGFKKIDGVNLFEGDFNWDNDTYIKLLVPQLKELVNFYTEHGDLKPDQMFNKRIDRCVFNGRERKKWCGIGSNMVFFDTDGQRYPCAYVTPMTFSSDDLENIMRTDFSDEDSFIDEDCYKNCYIYPVCSTCSGANYLVNKDFKCRNKSKCRINKLAALFIAELQANRILKDPEIFQDDNRLYNTIEAIKGIRGAYLEEFLGYLNS